MKIVSVTIDVGCGIGPILEIRAKYTSKVVHCPALHSYIS
jgi:hypothetical protein